jgi:hypothetical protein
LFFLPGKDDSTQSISFDEENVQYSNSIIFIGAEFPGTGAVYGEKLKKPKDDLTYRL